MHVSSAFPLAVASLVWRPRPDALVLTVVCKATYLLRPGTSPVASALEAPQPSNVYTHEGARRSLTTPSDLVPFKRRIDVLLGGNAHAPGGLPVAMLVARVRVGTMNKAISVYGDRYWTAEGTPSIPAPFKAMPLHWERAAGGPRSWNPVGIPPNGPLGGRIRWHPPNLQPVEFVVHRPDQVIPPVGFGPIAPHWPARMGFLGEHASGWTHETWATRPLPTSVDAAYFNAAPLDQQLEQLPPQIELHLENLHPEIPRLSTVIDDMCPLALVKKPGVSPQERQMRCDTLFIDAERGTCSLTWRAGVLLAHAEESVEVAVKPTRHPTTSHVVLSQRAALQQLTPPPVRRVETPAADLEDTMPLVAARANSSRHGNLLPREDETLPLGRDDDDDAETLIPAPASRRPEAQAVSALDDDAETLAPVPLPRPAETMPLQAESPTRPIEEDEGARTLVALPSGARGATLPFHPSTTLDTEDPAGTTQVPARPSLPAALPFRTATTDASDDEAGETLVPARNAQAHIQPLPFQPAPSTQAPPPSAPSSSLFQIASVPQVSPPDPPMPQLGAPISLSHGQPGAAFTLGSSPREPAEPPAERAEPPRSKSQLSLAHYARIKVASWRGDAPLSELLEQHGLDEVAWRMHERQQSESLAAEAREGRCDMALSLLAALEAAQSGVCDSRALAEGWN
ncbi:DUF2169 family type VI secretion system accessory protein [Chondromyces crocatus]|uniref:DUF2169 domain-containing protein n=1 Tax=Chondromyces crocatus TaxID=52 RepID=A0A0K1EIW3_CHOCO|nr:DUF2169 domain-containing protein [Chondromyces crocatus]AKT40602.1 uncharacterized protein CMC5_047580 [Chondromyces crocatus]